MLAYAHDVMHLISYGCYQYDPYRGWQTVKPCPAHVVCGRLPNIYDEGHGTMCPTDFHYRFPHALSALAPKQYNPLLPYAIEQYRNDKSSSIMQEPGAPSSEPGGTRGGGGGGGGGGGNLGPDGMRFHEQELQMRGSADQTTYPATAFPGPDQASGLPANIYTEKTNPMLASAAPTSILTREKNWPAGQWSSGSTTNPTINRGRGNVVEGNSGSRDGGPDFFLEERAGERSAKGEQQEQQQQKQQQHGGDRAGEDQAERVQRLRALSGGGVPMSASYPSKRKSLLSGIQLPFSPPAGAMRPGGGGGGGE